MPVLVRPAIEIPRIGARCSAWGASSPEDSITLSLSLSSVGASRETFSKTPPVPPSPGTARLSGLPPRSCRGKRLTLATCGAPSLMMRRWLKEVLAAGPRPALELRHEAAAYGIGDKALYVLRKTVGITLENERTPKGRWLWSLTPRSGGGGEDGARPGS
jgi:hypothetical protein